MTVERGVTRALKERSGRRVTVKRGVARALGGWGSTRCARRRHRSGGGAPVPGHRRPVVDLNELHRGDKSIAPRTSCAYMAHA